jgi:hypothetical protein
MRLARIASTLLLLAPLAGAAGEGAAPPPDAAAEERKALEEQIARELGSSPGGTAPAIPAPAAPAAAAAPAPAEPAKGGSGPLARLLLLPDLSAIGSFAGVYDSYDAGALSPRSGTTGPAAREGAFVFQELELALQAVVDPYARADVFTSFDPGGVSVEEAYLTTLALPAGLQLRAGRFFSPLGRINGTHPHTWEFLDAPLAHDRLVAADKLGGAGVDLSWLTPLPWFAELHLAAQDTTPYAGRDRLTALARLAQFFVPAEPLTIGLGLSAARREEPGAAAFRDLAAVDLLVKFRPISGRAYLMLVAEAFARRFRGLGADPDGGDGWGGYAQLFWRQDEWLGYGVRWDRAPAVPLGASRFSGTEQRWSAVADWFVTEFQRVGLQVARDARPGASTGWELLLHAEFVIGAHGAHPF